MEIFEIKKTVNDIHEKLSDSLRVENKMNNLAQLEKQTMSENFWESKEKEVILKQISQLKNEINLINKINEYYDNILILIEFIELENDTQSISELEQTYNEYIYLTNDFSNKILLNGQYDFNNAIMTINSGAGGTEACDWTSMVFRMYERYCLNKGFKIDVLDILAGDEAGIKSITFNVKGDFSYGLLSCERGVHRLVRISPFDSNARRHTSFTAVNVIPEIEDDVNINLNMSDVQIDTYRASGAGGQHVNTTDSAVRLTHIPTGIVVTCQNERSQIKNKESALKVLKAKLFQLELQKKQDEINDIKGKESKIEWGSQIRSYVMQPYKLVKDHRTKYEQGNVEKVLDGDLDEFISSYLNFRAKEQNG